MSRKQQRAWHKTQYIAADATASVVTRLFVEAIGHHQAGRVDTAEALYRRIIAIAPSHAESWSNLALALTMRGAHGESIAAAETALTLRPAYVEAHLNLVTALEALHQYERATAVYRTVIALAPDRDDLRANLGVNLERLDRLGDAAEAYRSAVALNPANADAQFNLARALCNLGRTEDSVAAYRRVVAIQPYQAAAFSNMGTLLCALGRFDEGAEAALRAAALVPDNPEILCNLGVVLQKQGKVNEAVEAYQRAVAVKPDYAAAFGNLGVALQEQFKFDEAVDALKRAIALKPDFDNVTIELIKMRRHICDWSEYPADCARLIEFIALKKDAIFMLLLMAFPSTPDQQLQCARQTMRRLNQIPSRFVTHPVDRGHPRTRIGYLSNDYRDHPVGRLLPDLFARHDRGRFEVFAYSMGTEDKGVLRRRIREGCEHFVDLHPLSDLEAADRINADAIDILVDLTGPTVGSRLEILVDRPAPVQVSFLGWPGTMGLDCIDYIIADAFLVPFDQQPFYDEKIVHLPACYQPSDPDRAINDITLTRAECGLPDGAFVFCSFNNTVKITPDMFDLWMRLLHRVENSILWLYCKSPTTIANLRRRAEDRGIAADRIVFATVAHMDVYLARLRLADLFLDSYPYNAGSTCNDALWVGLPVLTCAGDTYVSRMAGSLLTAVGLPELIAASLEDYEARAVALATQSGLLEGLRHRLVTMRDHCALFDMAGFTADLEAAYDIMQEKRRAGLRPAAFAVQRPEAMRASSAA